MIESRKYKEAKRGVEVKRGVDNVKKKKIRGHRPCPILITTKLQACRNAIDTQ